MVYRLSDYCSVNVVISLFTKLPWPEDREGTYTLESSCQLLTCLPLMMNALQSSFNVTRQAVKLSIPIL